MLMIIETLIHLVIKNVMHHLSMFVAAVRKTCYIAKTLSEARMITKKSTVARS